jgi:site-specific DNA-methyltransferase (adenine-specific)
MNERMLGPYLLGPNDKNQGVYTGDAKELALAIPDESVDLIFTDPPYLREYLPLYGWLASEAARVLKIGGWLFSYGAGEHLPNHLQCMGEYLDFFWVFALLHHGGYPRMWHKKLMSGYKPVMVYTKGTPSLNPWMSTVHSVAMDKRFHKWGQGDGLAIKIIDMLTHQDSVIFDPFAGSGTFPAACKMLGRRWLAFEIKSETAEDARQRIHDTQPPLFVLRPEQPLLL